MAILQFVTRDGQTLVVDEEAGTITCKRVTNPKAVYSLAERVIADHNWTMIDEKLHLNARSYTARFTKDKQRLISGPDNEFGLPESDLI